MHKVFISYHHANDQWYKEELIKFAEQNQIFNDQSVDTGDIDDDLDDETIRELIRDDYLKDTSVTILLVGTETKQRKHVDWELYSSMRDGRVNKKSGIIVITLPSTGCTSYQVAHKGEKEIVYPTTSQWTTITERAEFEKRYPCLPNRIIDNLLAPKAKISVTNWDKINVERLTFLVNAAYDDRLSCEYDLSRKMRKANSW
ncbi:MAG: TIR domain-containing protein [Deltaproteobacteria bacterium]